MSGRFHTDPHLDSSLLQFAIKLFGFPVLVQQLSFTKFSGLVIDKSDLLELGVIIQSYNQHVRLLPPEPWLVFASTKSTQVDRADVVMESSGPHRFLGRALRRFSCGQTWNSPALLQSAPASHPSGVPRILPFRWQPQLNDPFF